MLYESLQTKQARVLQQQVQQAQQVCGLASSGTSGGSEQAAQSQGAVSEAGVDSAQVASPLSCPTRFFRACPDTSELWACKRKRLYPD